MHFSFMQFVFSLPMMAQEAITVTPSRLPRTVALWYCATVCQLVGMAAGWKCARRKWGLCLWVLVLMAKAWLTLLHVAQTFEDD
jgi:hypothetical protein